jgi:hypothetical protein
VEVLHRKLHGVSVRLFASFAGVTALLEPAGQLAPVAATLHTPASECRARATSRRIQYDKLSA